MKSSVLVGGFVLDVAAPKSATGRILLVGFVRKVDPEIRRYTQPLTALPPASEISLRFLAGYIYMYPGVVVNKIGVK